MKPKKTTTSEQLGRPNEQLTTKEVIMEINEEAANEIMENVMTMSQIIAMWANADDEEIKSFDLKDKARNRLALKASAKIKNSIIKGDYDDFMLGVCSLCYAGVFGKSREKWKLLPMAADMSWRMAREALKAEIADAVERLIDEFQS
jgi:hypothetical protein